MEDITAVIMAPAGTGTGTGNGELIRTRHGLPDVLLVVISPLRVVVVRAIKTLINTMVAILGLGSTGAAQAIGIPITDFWDLAMKAGMIGLSAAAGSVLMTLAEIFGSMDTNFPKASV